MERTTNHLLVILALVLYLFCCATGADNSVSTKHDAGRRVLAGYSNLLFAAARGLFKGNGPVIKKLNDAYDIASRVMAAKNVTAKNVIEFTMDIIGTKKNFTEDNAIDYLNCQCDCPNLNLTGACAEEANYNNCNTQQKYCTSFEDNPKPLKCLNCSLIPQQPPPPPPSTTVPSPSHASPLSHFVDTLLMMISTTVTIIIVLMYFLI